MSTLSKQIICHANSVPEGGILLARELLHLANRPTVNRALSSLTRSKELLRISHGMYVLPIHSRFGTRAPSPAEVTQAISRQYAEIITSHGAAAANRLGLTTQVPTQSVYLTSGRNRRLALGAQTVELIHAHPWQLLFPDQYAGDVIRALSWLGPEHAHILLNKIPCAKLVQIVNNNAHLPTWISLAIKQYLHCNKPI